MVTSRSINCPTFGALKWTYEIQNSKTNPNKKWLVNAWSIPDQLRLNIQWKVKIARKFDEKHFRQLEAAKIKRLTFIEQ